MIKLQIKGTGETYTVNPTKIIALGLNYEEHVKESAMVKVRGFDAEIPSEPILFPKTPNVLIGPGDDIVLPAILAEYTFENERTDYEAELALIIRDTCSWVKPEDAYDYILGFTCMNDVSQRNIQHRDKAGWFRGKSFDTFGPIGPVLVPPEALEDPQNLNILCRLNGKVVQSSNTRHMIFTIPQIVAFVSKNFTLYPGDIILTGTPSGVGPLTEGDTVEVEIEGIGVLKNGVRRARTTG
ncbi:MAG: fumarylacetoacetate hydrolase family protein [Spirochaetales bacterium]|nr:fumarylacetoacetate hydrolase family protein [Spirochaetales bacterium]